MNAAPQRNPHPRPAAQAVAAAAAWRRLKRAFASGGLARSALLAGVVVDGYARSCGARAARTPRSACRLLASGESGKEREH
jgi:hypothetical protein